MSRARDDVQHVGADDYPDDEILVQGETLSRFDRVGLAQEMDADESVYCW